MNEFPLRIKLKKECYKKYGVHPDVIGDYIKEGNFYNAIISTPHLPSVTFPIDIIKRCPNDFEIIKP